MEQKPSRKNIQKNTSMTKGELKKKKKLKNRAVLATVVLSVVVLIFVAVGLINAFLDEKFGLLNIVDGKGDDEFETEALTEIDLSDEVFQDFHGSIDDRNLPLICDTKDVTNILLLATDNRGNEAGLSDSMILLSINEKTNKLVLCSFMRDILVKIPEDADCPQAGKLDKLTHVHSYGGPQLTMDTLKSNFNIQVEHFVRINFFSFVKVIDALGGLEMYLTSDEAWWINEFMAAPEIRDIFPSYSKKGVAQKDGVQKLNGLQALGHARNRRIGSDWARTERQRNIIQQVIKQATKLSLSEINNLLDEFLPMVTTNIPSSMLKDLTWNALSYLTYDVVSTRIPLDKTYTEVDYKIIPDLEVNCADLYEKIYEEEAPVVTTTKKNKR